MGPSAHSRGKPQNSSGTRWRSKYIAASNMPVKNRVACLQPFHCDPIRKQSAHCREAKRSHCDNSSDCSEGLEVAKRSEWPQPENDASEKAFG